jgi:arylsulfatase A
MTGQYNVRNYLTFGNMDPDSVTFGNLLKERGYRTAIAGKWQLGRDPGLPGRFGFDESCLWQHTRRPARYANPGLEYNGETRDFTKGEYGPDLVNEFALRFIRENKEKPFFLYYPMILTHDPYQPTPDSKDWDPARTGEASGQKEEHFGDMVRYMDKLVGKVVAELDTLALRDRTLMVFLGDNGTGRGATSRMGDAIIPGGKGQTKQYGMHVPLIVSAPGLIREPLVIDRLVDSTDFLPTLCEAAGAPLPKDRPCDGISFLPFLQGKKEPDRPWIYSWYSPRQGNDRTVREFVFDRHYKLYRDGSMFHWAVEPMEEKPLVAASLDPETTKAFSLLQKALDSYRKARPPELDENLPGASPSGKPRKAPVPSQP